LEYLYPKQIHHINEINQAIFICIHDTAWVLCTCHKDEVKAKAEYMSNKLMQFGWQFVVVGFLWSYNNPVGSKIGNPYQMTVRICI